MGQLNLRPVTFEDYRRAAQKRLPAQLFAYLDGGAFAEQTLAANSHDFSAYKVRQRVLKDVSKIETKLDILGQAFALPLILAPVGFAGMMRRRAEVQAALVAKKAGLAFCISTVGICPVEEVAEAVGVAPWFQLYMLKDRGHVQRLLAKARQAGCKTLVFTVDLPLVGIRYRDQRAGVDGGLGRLAKLRAAIEFPAHPFWFYDVVIKGRPLSFGNLAHLVDGAKSMADFKAFIDSQFDPACTWEDIQWLRAQWGGDLLLKGIMHPQDAKAAFKAGADGIIVSNHGGRQLDGVASSLSNLAEIRQAVGDKALVLMDGGVRSGLDILRARALGADAVLIGRPWIMALAARGTAGLSSYLRTLKDELEVSMALCGVTDIKAVNRQILDRP